MKEKSSQNQINPPLHWADIYAEKVIYEKKDKPIYTAASGITPSGTVHIGNFREIISVDLVVRALRERGKEVRFIYSWDDFDVFRKVPKNMPHPEILENYLRFPIDSVPDTTNQYESYAQYNEKNIEDLLPIVGISPIYLYQSKKYRSHTYAKQMKEALDKKEELRKALDEYRSEPLPKDWMPISIFCERCHKDTTKIKDYNGEWSISYICECSKNEILSADLRTTSLAKLPWRIDWPMRWVYENVDFEPAGKDHHSEGGSFDTSRLVVKVLGGEAPVTFQYDFISIKGRGGKISSSSGEVISLKDVLEIYTPELTRYLFVSTRPNAEFSISFDLDVLKIYEDYDKTQRIYYGQQEVKNEKQKLKQKRIYELSQIDQPEKEMPYSISFRHLTTLSQVFEGNTEKVIEELKDVQNYQIPKLSQKIKCAFRWVRNYAPEEFRFSLRQKENFVSLNKKETQAIDLLKVYLEKNQLSLDEKDLGDNIYEIARTVELEPVHFFKVIYRLLINKEQGPRLAHFIVTLGVSRTLELLKTSL